MPFKRPETPTRMANMRRCTPCGAVLSQRCRSPSGGVISGTPGIGVKQECDFKRSEQPPPSTFFVWIAGRRVCHAEKRASHAL